MATEAKEAKVARINFTQEKRFGQSLTTVALRRLRRDRLTLLAIGVLTTMVVIALFAPVINEHVLGVNPNRTNAQGTFMPPGTPGHILGTDDLGRDHLARLLVGGQVSLGIAFVAALLSLTIGVSLGIMTGYYGGVADDIVIWIIATLSSIPFFFLLLIVSAVLAPGPLSLVLILGLLGWTGTTRLVRGETLSLREREYIVSARAIGASPFNIMSRHILPNLFSVIIVTIAIDIGSLILVEAGLSFLGLGVKPPTPTWGNMLTNAQTFFRHGSHLVIMPGVLIFVTVLCMYVIGDGIRDAFDPTQKD